MVCIFVQHRSSGVHGWLQVAAIEFAVSEPDVFASFSCICNISALDHKKKFDVNVLFGFSLHTLGNVFNFVESGGLVRHEDRQIMPQNIFSFFLQFYSSPFAVAMPYFNQTLRREAPHCTESRQNERSSLFSLSILQEFRQTGMVQGLSTLFGGSVERADRTNDHRNCRYYDSSKLLQHHHFGLHEDEHRDRWRQRTLSQRDRLAWFRGIWKAYMKTSNFRGPSRLPRRPWCYRAGLVPTRSTSTLSRISFYSSFESGYWWIFLGDDFRLLSSFSRQSTFPT